MFVIIEAAVICPIIAQIIPRNIVPETVLPLPVTPVAAAATSVFLMPLLAQLLSERGKPATEPAAPEEGDLENDLPRLG